MEIDLSKVVSTQFIDATGLTVFHYQSELLIELDTGEKINASGFGSSQTQKQAIRKSLYELFERIAFHKESHRKKIKSSNGFAAHVDFESAARSAAFEAIERHVFFSFWLKKKPPKWLAENRLNSAFKLYSDLSNVCERLDFELKIGILMESEQGNVAFGLVRDKKNRIGGFVNTSAHVTFEIAVSNVLVTLCRYITIAFNRISENIPLFAKIDSPKTPIEHFEFYLNPDNFSNILWLLGNGVAETWTPIYNEIEIELVSREISFPLPCEVAYAYHKEMQGYFVGDTTSNKICELLKIDSTLKLNFDFHPLP